MSKNKQIALKVTGLSKSFRLPTEKASGIKQALVNLFKGVRGYNNFHVLTDINFEVEQGDFIGIVGRNGSGKSTLLKLISQIYTPDEGSVEVDGKLVPFIELGVGFNMELTGRENIYMNGALLGFSNEEIDDIYDEIVDFAELRDFMNQKLKNYSSGMQVRLAFSIAIRAEADILVLDEVLAVGDESFQRKCNEYFANLKKNKKTVILVTHDMGAVRKYCNKAILLKDGEIVINGSPEDVANEYALLNLEQAKHDARIDGEFEKDKTQKEEEESVIKNLKVELLSSKQISQKDEIEIKVSYQVLDDMKTKAVINLIDVNRNTPLSAGNSKTLKNKTDELVTHTAKFTLPQINNTTIRVICAIWNDDGDTIAFYPESKSPTFILRRDDYPNPKKPATFAVMFDRGEWK